MWKRIIIGLTFGLLIFGFVGAVSATPIQMKFTVSDFISVYGNPVPVNSISGSFIWGADSVHSAINSLTSVDLNIAGYTYPVTSVNFINNLPLLWLGAGDVDILSYHFNNDFSIYWFADTLTLSTFAYSTTTYDDLYISGTYDEFSIQPIPEPTTMLLLGTGLVGVAGAARRRKKNQA